MLEKLFTSRSRVKIIELLLFSEPLHLREVARRTKVTPPQVRKELENLEKLGLVKKTRKGNLILFEMNRESPIHEEIKRIFLKTKSLGSILQDNIKNIGNVQFAIVYGSIAAGDEREGSDIDLLVIGDDVDESELLSVLKKVEYTLSREVSYILWTRKEFLKNCGKKHHLLVDVIKNPIIEVVGDLNEFRRLVEEGCN